VTVVDAHVHVWDPDLVEGELGPPGSAVRMLRALDAAGIDAGVLVQPSVHASDHRYLLAAVDRAPDRLVAVVLLEPDEAGAVPRLPADRRVRGVRAPLIRSGPGWVASVGDALWTRARAESWVVGAFARSDQLAELEPLLERFADVPVGIDHIARLDLAADGRRGEALGRVLALARYPNVHVKLSALAVLSSEAPPYRDVHEEVRRVVSAFGPERTIWGSDYPNILALAPYAQSLAAAREALADLTSDEQAQVFGGTAWRLYFARPAELAA
jgi:L-fuconolactonase